MDHEKRGARRAPLVLRGRASRPSRHRASARRALDLARVQAARADLHLLDLAVDHACARPAGSASTCGASCCSRARRCCRTRRPCRSVKQRFRLNGHGSVLDQLDARHLGAVTLAVAGLENARVAAVPRRELRADLLEQLVGRLALAGCGGPARRRSCSVPERALVISFSTNGRSSFAFASVVSIAPCSMSDDARLRMQRELLLAGPAKLTPRFTMPHCLTPPCRRARRRRPGSAACPNRARERSVAVLLEPHPEIQSFTLEEIGDLLERLLAEVLDLQDLALRLADQIAERADVRVLERVHRANRQLEVVDRRAEQAAEPRAVAGADVARRDRSAPTSASRSRRSTGSASARARRRSSPLLPARSCRSSRPSASRRS